MVFPGRPADLSWFCFAQFLDINKLILGPELIEEAEFGGTIILWTHGESQEKVFKRMYSIASSEHGLA